MCSADHPVSYPAAVGFSSVDGAPFRNPGGCLKKLKLLVADTPLPPFDSSTVTTCLLSFKVWRVGGNWDVEATISKPFEDCDDTLVRRLSWSPDGQFLVATNSKDGVRTPEFSSPLFTVS